MTQILDRYLIRIFLAILSLLLLAFIAVFLIVDLFENLDKFVDNASLLLVINYYFYYIPYIIVLICPIAMLLSCLFSIGLLSKHNELVAMRANGISLYRTLSPLFTVTLLISVLIFFWGDFIVPYTNAKKLDILDYQIKKKPRESRLIKRDVYLQDSFNHIMYIKRFNTAKKNGSNVIICHYRENAIIYRLDAESIMWKNKEWILEKGNSRKFSAGGESFEKFTTMKFTDTDIQLTDIMQKSKKPEEMHIFELKNHIRKMRRMGQDPQKQLVDFHLKLSFSLANFIIVLFGAPLMSNVKRGGTSWGFGVSIFICFTYYGLIRIGQAMGYNETLPPLVAAWLGNMIFGLAGLFILYKVPK